MALQIDIPIQRMAALSTQYFASIGNEIRRLQSDGCDVIRLDEGSPDLPPPPHIIAALVEGSVKPDTHSYQAHNGPDGLRLAWSKMYRNIHGVDLDPETEILPLLGSKEGVFHFIQAHVETGDILIIPDPGYMTYTRATLFAGGVPFHIPLVPERDYLPDFEVIPKEIARKAKMLWLNYPNNPTSATADLDFFTQAIEFGRRHGILICHDAAYTQVYFNGKTQPSLLQVPGAKDVAVEFNTLSKSHNMAGWRVGAVVGNSQAIHSLYQLKTNADSSHFLPILEAATVAMTSDQDWLAERNKVYQRRSELIVESLRRLGWAVKTPQASLYIWTACPPGWSSVDFTRFVLSRAHVSLTPGSVFGRRGEGFFRLSFTASEARLQEAMDRLHTIQF